MPVGYKALGHFPVQGSTAASAAHHYTTDPHAWSRTSSSMPDAASSCGWSFSCLMSWLDAAHRWFHGLEDLDADFACKTIAGVLFYVVLPLIAYAIVMLINDAIPKSAIQKVVTRHKGTTTPATVATRIKSETTNGDAINKKN